MRSEYEANEALAAKSLGRYWGSADSATLTEFADGDAVFRLTWADGAYLIIECETHARAREILNGIGFVS